MLRLRGLDGGSGAASRTVFSSASRARRNAFSRAVLASAAALSLAIRSLTSLVRMSDAVRASRRLTGVLRASTMRDAIMARTGRGRIPGTYRRARRSHAMTRKPSDKPMENKPEPAETSRREGAPGRVAADRVGNGAVDASDPAVAGAAAIADQVRANA